MSSTIEPSINIYSHVLDIQLLVWGDVLEIWLNYNIFNEYKPQLIMHFYEVELDLNLTF